ncbi:Hypothetical_protein [Hexamita inflata]|uniref:Hypothetical_protein n=1 Tax=Hexamita inflata TaxID=28002 RepID=A0AA86U7A5_9EUKA|nr:Hypothetical protein HINF_LOCUS31499 [Hexamita inflata]
MFDQYLTIMRTTSHGPNETLCNEILNNCLEYFLFQQNASAFQTSSPIMQITLYQIIELVDVQIARIMTSRMQPTLLNITADRLQWSHQINLWAVEFGVKLSLSADAIKNLWNNYCGISKQPILLPIQNYLSSAVYNCHSQGSLILEQKVYTLRCSQFMVLPLNSLKDSCSHIHMFITCMQSSF